MNILFLSGKIKPLDSGDSLYTNSVLRRFEEGYNVAIYALVDYAGDGKRLFKRNTTFTNKLLRMVKYGSRKIYYCEEMRRAVVEYLDNSDEVVVFVDHIRMAGIFFDSLKEAKKKPKFVYLAHNVEHDNLVEDSFSRRNHILGTLSMILNWKLRSYEEKLLKESYKVFCISDADKRRFENKYETSCDFQIIQPALEVSRVKEKYRKTKNLLMLGSMDWYPNVTGFFHFKDKIFSKILEIDNQYRLFVVGKNPTDEIKSTSSENIIVTGRVDDVGDYIRDSDFLVLPSRVGGGVKIKILESLLKGLPVITYRENINGYENVLCPEFCVKDQAEFVKAILREYQNDHLERQIQNAIEINSLRMKSKISL